MTKNFLPVLGMVLFAFVFVGCKEQTKENTIAKAEVEKTVVEKGEKYSVSNAESSITWKGSKPTGSHSGTVSVSAGEFIVAGDKISSGSFSIDMTSITEVENSQRLIGHLKSPDFFNVEEFATASFEVTGTNSSNGKINLSGNLTIKGIQKDISFPITVVKENNTLTLSSETFTIDRTRWDIKYKSKTIFGDLGDKFINDEIELKVSVKATKS